MVNKVVTVNEIESKEVLSAIRSEAMFAEIRFTETEGAGLYRGSVVIPAEATILNIFATTSVSWSERVRLTVADVDADIADFYMSVDITDASNDTQDMIRVPQAQSRNHTSPLDRVVFGRITTRLGTGATGRTRLIVVFDSTTQVFDAIKNS